MPIRSNYRHYNVSQPKKQTFDITKYKGVDYSSAKLTVKNDHAIDISNIVYKDNVNQKRTGWEQVAKVLPISYQVKVNNSYVAKSNPTNINGIWTFYGEDGQKYTIAHIGRLLFELKNFNKEKTFLETKLIPLIRDIEDNGVVFENVPYSNIELNDEKSQAFYGSKRLYILGGNKYCVLTANNGVLDLRLVEDDVETYIPTTTIGITYKDSAVESAAPLDDVNMLTQYRKNKLVSGTYVDDGVSLRTTQYWDFSLDTNVHPKNAQDINNIKITISQLLLDKVDEEKEE